MESVDDDRDIVFATALSLAAGERNRMKMYS